MAADGTYGGADGAMPSVRFVFVTSSGLGPVDIHFSQIMAATRNSTAANDTTVFS